MSTTPKIHLFAKSSYATHTLQTLPSPSNDPLPPSSIRLQSKIIGLTTNNLTYARMGHILGWWGIYAQPSTTPAPYTPDPDSTDSYTTVPAWGYATILSSTHPSVPAGSCVYGFIPTSSLPYDVTIEQTPYKNQFLVTNEARKGLWTVYNRLQLFPAGLDSLLKEKDDAEMRLGYDALMQGLFATGYNMNRHAFAWDESARSHPSGAKEWSGADADLSGATVVLLSGSGKTAMSFAWCLRRNRPQEQQPKTMVAVCSEASKSVCEGSGFYDETVLYGEVEGAKQGLQKAKRVVLIDFGARGSAKENWTNMLASLDTPYKVIGVGAEVKPQTPEETNQMMKKRMGGIIVNANVLREKGIETEGDTYFEQFYGTFDRFKTEGGIPGLKLEWGEGMEAWEKGWTAFCEDKVGANTGLVYKV